MKQFIVKLIVVAALGLSLLMPVAGIGRAHALVVAPPRPVFLCLALSCGPTPFFGPLCQHGHHAAVCHGHRRHL